MKTSMLSLCLIAVMCMATSNAAPAAEEKADIAVKRPLVQVALLLDNSGSMQGLIEQAKAQLWTFINEFATSHKDGLPPRVQVALYIYGDPPATRLLELTDDLDRVSEKLFAVTISGGSEYCGEVIQTAINELAWSSDPGDLKVIFIAGNEPFTQGPVDYRVACKAAIARGVLVNTIHCGSEAEGISGQWRDGSLLADGRFMNIDHHRAIVQINSPQDAELARLGAELNTTYLAYGIEGERASRRQREQDSNAMSVSAGNMAQRAVAKSSDQYENGTWDLVDAVRKEGVSLDKIAVKDLPEPMRVMSAEQRQAFLEEQDRKRAEIQATIRQLNEQREKHIAAVRRQAAVDGGDTLESAMIKAVREQAQAKGFELAAPR